jgi:Tol biopolymer transport system component
MRTLRLARWAILATTGLVVGAVWAAPAGAATGQIVYESYASGDSDIWIMNADGTGQTNLTPGTTDSQEYDPELSPDGARIAFISNRVTETNPDVNFEIFVMDVDGANVTQVTISDNTAPGAFVQSYDPTWSPDGSMLAFSGYREWSSSEIFVTNADGSGTAAQITSQLDFANKWEPDWSPDGTSILFTWGWDEFSQDLHVIGPDGSGELSLTPGTETNAERNPAWSPDGTRIAFRNDKDCCGIFPNVNAEVYVMEYPSGVLTRVTENDAIDEDPAWSPDGTQITFTSLRNGAYDLFLVDAPPVPVATATTVRMVSAGTAEASVVPINTSVGDQLDPFWGEPGTTSTTRLTVSTAGTGSGVVRSAPAGIECGSDCTEEYLPGTEVTLRARPASGSRFTGWSGACTGRKLRFCTVTMDSAKSVTATFDLRRA